MFEVAFDLSFLPMRPTSLWDNFKVFPMTYPPDLLDEMGSDGISSASPISGQEPGGRQAVETAEGCLLLLLLCFYFIAVLL